MELRHIRYFLAVAQSLNFTKAAQQLHIAQPPLSRQMRQLEEDLGVELFARDKRPVELTKAGHAFLEEARKLIAQAGHAVEAARQAELGKTGTVRIGIAAGLGNVVSPIVFEFHKRCPGIEVECRDIFSLNTREIDVGFLRPPLDQESLDCELLYEEKFVVILPKTHRLAKRRAVRMKDVAAEPLITFDRNFSSGLYDKILGLYSRHGLTPRLFPRYVGSHDQAGAIMVASGKAIILGAGAIVNRSVAGIQLASTQLNEPEAKIEVYAAWRREDDSPALRAFLDSMRRTMAPKKQASSTTAGSFIGANLSRAAGEQISYGHSAKKGRL